MGRKRPSAVRTTGERSDPTELTGAGGAADWAEADFVLNPTNGTLTLNRHEDSGAGFDDILIQVAESVFADFASAGTVPQAPRTLRVRVECTASTQDITHDQITDLVGRGVRKALASDVSAPQITETGSPSALRVTCRVLAATGAPVNYTNPTRNTFDNNQSSRLVSVCLDGILSALRQRNEELDVAHAAILERFQADLAAVEGVSFDSLENNKLIAEMIQQTADRIRVAFSCTKPGCGQPARFRCSTASNMSNGAFVFTHGRNTHGGTPTIPKLVAVAAPPDGRKTKKSSETS